MFPNNQIPANRIRPFAKNFLNNYLPRANDGANFYSFAPIGNRLDQNQWISRVDYNIGENDKINFRVFYNDVPQVQPCSSVSADWLCDLPTRFQNYTLGEDHIFSPSLINSFHLSYVRSAFGLTTRKDFSLTGSGPADQRREYQYRLWVDAAIDAGHLGIRDGGHWGADARRDAHHAHQRHSLVESRQAYVELRL